jgi:proteasome lid subunit RPN8/RPN11
MPSSEVAETVEVSRDQIIEIVKTALPEMVMHASELPKEEVVGVVTLDGTVIRLHNEAVHRDQTFILSPSQLDIPNIVCVYHSHPNGDELISVTDERGLKPIPAVIVTHSSVILWWYDERIGYYRIWDRHYGIE